MVIKKQSVLNAANLSFLMVNVSQEMLGKSNQQSIFDLKAGHHGLRCAEELFKLLAKTQR